MARIDAALTDPAVMQYYAKKLGFDNIALAQEIEKKELVLAVREGAVSANRLDLLKKLFP